MSHLLPSADSSQDGNGSLSSTEWEKVEASDAPMQPSTVAASTNTSTVTPRSLDLVNNDNSFHILANLIVDLLKEKYNATNETLTLEPAERQQLERLLPTSARQGFVDAVQARVARLGPNDPVDETEKVVCECIKLHLHMPGSQNPVVAALSVQEQPIVLSLTVTPPTVVSGQRSIYSNDESFSSRRSNKPISAQELAKQQLLSEIEEAERLVHESVSPDTANFWREHVSNLRMKLGALHEQHSQPQVSSGLSKYLVASSFRSQTQTSYDDAASEGTGNKYQVINDDHHRMSLKCNGTADSTTVDVVAPADLPGGYHFEAEINGHRFLATVPPEGVKQGQTFLCPMVDLNTMQIDIPIGYWKDGILSCMKHGLCHPAFWNSLFCPLLVLGQIGHRVNLDFLGRHREVKDGIPNRRMMGIITIFWGAMNLAIFAGYNIKWSHNIPLNYADLSALLLLNVVMLGFVIFVTQSTRFSIRERFLIREEHCCCSDMEDVCCSTFCLPLTVCQMARHTANYERYKARCCTKTGLQPGVNVLLEPRRKDEPYLV